MKLLFDENLSPELPRSLETLFVQTVRTSEIVD
jgi:predicted nuclease of predicted toxin-antitoxin system